MHVTVINSLSSLNAGQSRQGLGILSLMRFSRLNAVILDNGIKDKTNLAYYLTKGTLAVRS